jgi:hypothetical protein
MFNQIDVRRFPMLDGGLRGNAASPTLRKKCECANLPNRLAAPLPRQASVLKPALITAYFPHLTRILADVDQYALAQGPRNAKQIREPQGIFSRLIMA